MCLGDSSGFGLPRQALRDEVERLGIEAAAVVERAALALVEVPDVADVESAFELDLVAEVEGHLVHEPEDASARRPRDVNIARVESTENVERQPLGAELFLDGSHDISAERAQFVDAKIGSEDGEERVGLDEQEALASVDPQQVRVPVILARRLLGLRDGASEQTEKPLRTAHDHRGRA